VAGEAVAAGAIRAVFTYTDSIGYG